jgi:hypothetical protein
MIYVHAVGRLAYSGGLPSWLRQSSVVGQFPFGSAGRDFEFSLMPGEYVVEAFAKDSGPGPITETSRKIVHIGPGERVKVDLRLGPVAQIDFRGGLVPGLVAELWMAEGDGPFELRDKLTGGGHLRMVQTVMPGTYRWRMRFFVDEVEHAALPAAETLEGTVTVAAGAKVEVPVPAAPSR